jgi:hypothetical protein
VTTDYVNVLSELEEKVKDLSRRTSHISDEEVVSLIREDRERNCRDATAG